MTKKKTVKKKVGGARKGAGRPKVPPASKATKTKFVRCSPDVNEAFNVYLDGRNAGRLARGLPMLSFSRWAREVLLHAAGRGDLTEATNSVVGDS